MLTDELIERTLERLSGVSVGVLGDLFLDRYLDIDARLTEPSLETGLDAYQVVCVRAQPGAAGTVINNLAALGVGRIVPLAIIGDDGEGYELRQALARMTAVDQAYIRSWDGRRTPTYTKPMLESPGEPARELNRLDIKNRTPTPPEAIAAILADFESTWNEVDAWIVLDQVSEEDCGVVTGAVRNRLAELAHQAPGKFVLADSRERIRAFRQVCVKPNAREGSDIEAIRATSGRHVFLTQGEHGIRLFRPGDTDSILIPAYPVAGRRSCGKERLRRPDSILIPAYPVAGPVDPVGAGDSVSAGIAAAIAAGATPEQAAAFGNLVASITVQQLGTTGTANPSQVRARWREVRTTP